MCLGVPGKIVDVYESFGTRMGKVDFEGVVKEVCLAYLPELQIGDYTIVHVGFAITKIDEKSAQETLQLFRDMGILDEELNTMQDAEAEQTPTMINATGETLH